jgi:quinoprotein glucose dehydrogenase
MLRLGRVASLVAMLVGAACGNADEALNTSGAQAGLGWPAYGGDAGGSRYSHASQIDRSNVSRLEQAWTYRTGEFSHDAGDAESDDSRAGPCSNCHGSNTKFEATPILHGGNLYLSTPFNRVIAIDAASGEERWSHDPQIDIDINYSEGFISRGVSYWENPNRNRGDSCWGTILFGTIDARLIALDSESGGLCSSFGEEGEVDLSTGVGEVEEGQYLVTSPPAIVNGLVVVGSALGDNRRVEVERGIVRAFDAETGELEWSWDPIPRDPSDPAYETWTPEAARRTGAANVWSIISADPERDLLFVPTSSPAPDFYGGERLGAGSYANSVVALRASTGEVVWHFQVVHHDIWDYDVPAQPTLIEIERNGERIPAVAVATKMGFLHVLHRETGEPLFGVEERPVPRSTVPGEEAWPTQPFPAELPMLHPTELTAADAWGITPEETEFCRAMMAPLRAEGIFTPPSLEGTLMYPFFGGGMNWGGMSWHAERNIVVTTVLRMAAFVRLHPRAEFREAARNRAEGEEFTGQAGTPYGMSRAPLIAPSGLPCSPPPWGLIVAVDLNEGELLWERPLGVQPGLEDVAGSEEWGAISFGGPITTAGDVVFVGASADDMIRGFDIESGALLWEHQLPAGGQATPMTYELDGRQYLVIAAGGRDGIGSAGDYVVAFALPGG